MEKTAHPTFRRRNYFIKKGLQSRFALGFSLAVLMGFFLNLFIVYFLIDRQLSAELYKIHLKIRTTAEVAGPILLKLGAVTVPAILAVAALTGYYLTRRVEQPLNSFREAVRKIGQGDFSQRLTETTHDSIPETFNRTAASLEGAFGALRGHAASLEESLLRLSGLQGAPANSGEELLEAMREFKAKRALASLEVSRFKV